MSCTDVQTIQAGDGSKTRFSFDFPYILKTEIKVYFWDDADKSWDEIQTDGLLSDDTNWLGGTDVYPWTVTDANPTIVEFTSTPPPAPTGEQQVPNVKIRRVTSIDDIKAIFSPGSAIRSDDLNKNFEQLRYALQESYCQEVPQTLYDYLNNYFWNNYEDTVRSDDSWENSDEKIATTSASSFQYDTIVSLDQPDGSLYRVGKTWLQNDDDLTLRIWNGNGWIAVASGGDFTQLTKVVYVDATNGDDASAGHRISAPKRTIRAAVDQINAETTDVGSGSVVIVSPGVYAERFPIDLEQNDISIVGESLRNCIIHPVIGAINATEMVAEGQYRINFVGTTDFTQFGAENNNIGTVFYATGAATGTGVVEDIAVQTNYDVDVPEANELTSMFRVNSGAYFQNLTLMGMKASGARGGNALDTDQDFGLPTNQGWNFSFLPGAVIRKSPYIQNCTNFSDSRINNVNFTPHTPGEGSAADLTSSPTGGGILIDGSVVGAQSRLRSMVADSYTHTALDGPGIFVTNNGYTQVTSSYAFFNHYHLKCLNGGQANLAASTSDFGRYSLIADGRSPDNIFTANCVEAIDADGGSEPVTTIRVSHGFPHASWHGFETRPAPNMLLSVNNDAQIYPILSCVPEDAANFDPDNPLDYTGDWIVTIFRPSDQNRSVNLGFSDDVAIGTGTEVGNVQFWLRSMIASSGHTMEYVGSGTNYGALPENGGTPVEANQRTIRNNGAIWTAITDHNGKFTVGDFFEVDQQRGFITIPEGSIAFDLLSDLTPQLGGDLDVNSHTITGLPATPTSDDEAASKLYVDNSAAQAAIVRTFFYGFQREFDGMLTIDYSLVTEGDGVSYTTSDYVYKNQAHWFIGNNGLRRGPGDPNVGEPNMFFDASGHLIIDLNP